MARELPIPSYMRKLSGFAAAIVVVACSHPAETPDAVAFVDTGTDVGGDSAPCMVGPERDGPYAPLTITGETEGVMDPSIAYPVGAAFGLLAYTEVPDAAHVHIAIAVSTDAGATWVRQGAVTQAQAITIATSDTTVCGTATCTGTLVQETPSVIVDATDPDPSRRIKVFVHEYFFNTGMNFELGYVALYTAATPAGPWTETKLFGWSSASSLSSSGVIYNIDTSPDLAELAHCLIVGEPGALVRATGTIDLALACPAPAPGGATMDIRLVRSFDHGQTWHYVSKLLDGNDAIALGSTVPMIGGSDLFYAGGAYYLMVTPQAPVSYATGAQVGARGCVVTRFADFDAGTIARCGGTPVIAAAYRGNPGDFVGACTADAGATASGMLIPVPDVSVVPPTFHTFAAELGVP
jgi:hypothetical protein